MGKKNLMDNDFSRNTFSKWAVSILSAAILLPATFSSYIAFPSLCEAFPRTPEDIIEESCGDNNTEGEKVLIAYDTVHGSTTSIAEKIGEILCEKGFQVDVRLARWVKDISDYDAVIVGSAVRELKWLLDATWFLRRHKETLSEIPVAYFFVCAALAADSQRVQEQVTPIYMDPILEKFPEIVPVDIRGFGGAIDFTNYNIYEKLLIWGFGSTENIDFRNWEKVTEWAETISDLL
jgi:menaquinone-dependent protoporphyrinogen oxidase